MTKKNTPPAAKRVLIVDCDETALSELREKLQAPNLAVDVARGGDAALLRVEQRPPDLILTSLEMPSPNGMDILHHVRFYGLSIPVIIYSKSPLLDEELRQKVIAQGAYAFLPRPLVINDLYEAVETALDFMIEGRERRRYPRISIRLEMQLDTHGEQITRLRRQTYTTDISLGGLSFEKEPCTSCHGYQRGGVHPECPLRRFYLGDPDSAALGLKVLLYELPQKAALESTPVQPQRPHTISVQAKIAHVIMDSDREKEYVGVKFINLQQEERERLKSFLRAIIDCRREELLRQRKTRL
jgi:DNA-binding response OmpR family regulator